MSVSEPGKIITPWAESGLKNTIPPAANPATGRAGFDQGFSAINMTAKEAGGIPPFGQDFNGIFYEVTNILRYMQAGGQPTFDAALATAIGGYPKGAMVLGGDGVTLWQSKVGSNFSDPNVDASGWGTFDIGLKADLAAPGGASLVGYSFNGVADSVRTVLSKLRDSAANIEDFGAAGDGIADDTAAFQTANNLLQADTYIALSPGKSYKITGVTFTNKISLGCPNGRAKIISDTGVHWVIPSDDLDISIENIDIIPTLNPDINNKTTAVRIEVTDKKFGSAGYATISGIRVKRGTTTGFYNGIVVENQPVILDGCEVALQVSHTNPLAKDGSIAYWEVNSGDGVLLIGATYSFLRNCKVYYAMNAYRCVGQIEEVHMNGCMALINRKCFVFESLSRPANQHRINNCHGVTYLRGIEMGDNTGRNVLCSVESSSILAAGDASAAQIIYANLFLDGANINNFQAFNNGTRGSDDIGIYLRTFDGVGARRVMVSGLHCRGVGTGVYLDSNERNYISDVSMFKSSMVGPAPKVYNYGPNNTSAPVSIAYGFPDQDNVFPARITAPRMMATESIGLKAQNTISGLGEEQLKIRNVAGNFWIDSADESGVLQHNAGIDQGGAFRAKSIYPLVDGTYYLGSGALRWNTVFATSAAINTSDERHKPIIEVIPDTLLDAWAEVDWGNRYKLDDAIVLKGEDGARWHFGLIAQWVEAVFKAHDIDGFTLGLLCFDEWGEQEEIIEAVPAIMNDEGVVIEPGYTYVAQQARDAGSRYGIRYEEALALEAALQRRERKRDREAFEVFKSEVLVRLQKLEA